MASKAVVDAVEARLAANWSACPVYGLNSEAETPADGSPFLVVQYPVARSEQMSVGSPGANLWREEGAIRIVIHAQRGEGAADGLTWADELAALFRGKIFDGVTAWAPSPPVIDANNESGNYFALAIAIPYQFDLIG